MVGEIGRDRRETLYEMSWLEILLILRGYYRGKALHYQLLRLTAYGAFFSQRDASGMTPEQFIPLYVDEYINIDAPPLTEDEVDELRAEMDAINANIRNEENQQDNSALH